MIKQIFSATEELLNSLVNNIKESFKMQGPDQIAELAKLYNINEDTILNDGLGDCIINDEALELLDFASRDASDNFPIREDITALPTGESLHFDISVKYPNDIGFAVTDNKPLVTLDLSDAKKDFWDYEITQSEYDHEADIKWQKEAAYYLWQNAGCPEGRDLEFWLDAERQMYGYTLDEMEQAYLDFELDLDQDLQDLAAWYTDAYLMPPAAYHPYETSLKNEYAEAEQDLLDGKFKLYTLEEFTKRFVKP